MAEFQMMVAGRVGRINSIFESTRDYCRAYLTQQEPDFSVTVRPEDLVFEQEQYDDEARLEGFRLRKFTDPFLERAAIQRKFAEFLFDHDTLLFHGSAVAVDGEGYLFTARSGTGKSTHTRLWREVFGERAVMINDDKPFLQIKECGAMVCGAPWSGKHGLDSNITVPLKGICILERGTENRIWEIDSKDALPMLLHQCYVPLDPAKGPRLHALAAALATNTPLWRMTCSKEPQAALTAWESMKK